MQIGVQLLFDADEVVARAAINAARRKLGRDGFNPVYAAPIVTLLRHRRLKHDARGALVDCGEAVIPSLMHFVNDAREHHWVRRALPKTIAADSMPRGSISVSASRGVRDG